MVRHVSVGFFGVPWGLFFSYSTRGPPQSLQSSKAPCALLYQLTSGSPEWFADLRLTMHFWHALRHMVHCIEERGKQSRNGR